MSVGRDVPAEEDLCSEERQELCCFQTIRARGNGGLGIAENSLLHSL